MFFNLENLVEMSITYNYLIVHQLYICINKKKVQLKCEQSEKHIDLKCKYKHEQL